MIVGTDVSSGSFSSITSAEIPIDSYVRSGSEEVEGVVGEGSAVETDVNIPWRLDNWDALRLSSSLSEKSLSVTVMMEW